jgi:multidrug efflux pump subunit AcrA (membrane-fusion protein)
MVLVLASAAFFWGSRDRKTVQAHQASSNSFAEVVFASSGRVEGLSDTTQVGAAADGVLKAIYVKENQFVTKGTLLGEIACDDLKAMLQTALAEADGTRQARIRLLRGARDEQKRVATKKTAAAHATFAEATSRLSMQRSLYEGGEISRAAYEQADRDFGVAEASRPQFGPRNCSPRLRCRKKRRGQTPKCSPRKAACERHKNGSRSAQFRLRLLELF